MIEKRNRNLLLGLLAAALVFGVVVSQFASSNPDGLEYVAEQEGFIDTAEAHAFGDAPLADYGENLTDNGTLNTAVAGFTGVVVTLAVGYGLFWLIRRRSGDRDPATS
jgi:hypothetical protein